MSSPWWSHEGLEVHEGRLRVAGRDAESLAREHGTPLYVYDTARVQANLCRLQAALERARLRHRLLFALKANRHPGVLARLRSTGTVGIDACSPNEVDLVLESGWKAEEISFTGTCLSRRDLARILPHPLLLNLDSLSAIRQVGERDPGRAIGLRLNPRVGAGYAARFTYAGDKPTKFGIYPDQVEQALEEARRHDLRVRGLHFHVGSGWLQEGLGSFLEAARRVAEMARRIQELEYINVGGGIGGCLQESEQAPDLDEYAGGIARHLGPLGATIFFEPGDFLVRDAGVILVQVVGVDEKGGQIFVGVDCGSNAYNAVAFYQIPQEVVLCRAADAPPGITCTIAGHINEAGDIFAERCRLPELREGDILALLNAGGYGAAMASQHCYRPHALEIAL
ncbi:MAG: diaminopimelate decarboxylase [Acidobacteriota bacterium]